MGRHILEDPEKFKFERREGNYLEMRGHLRAAESVGQQLECAAKILLPQVLVSTKHFDFGTGYIGDTFKLEICLDNVSQCDSAVHFEYAPGVFSVQPHAPVLRAGQVCTIEISFCPVQESDYIADLLLTLYDQTHHLKCVGRGTSDEAFRNTLKY